MRSKSKESIMAPEAIAPDQSRRCTCNLDLFVSALAPLSYKRAGFLSALVGLLHDETSKIPLFAPAGEHFEKRGRTLRILRPNKPYSRILPHKVKCWTLINVIPLYGSRSARRGLRIGLLRRPRRGGDLRVALLLEH